MKTNGGGICDLISEDGGTPYAVAVDPAMCTMTVVDRYPEGPWSNVNQPIISSVTTDAITLVNFQQTTTSTMVSLYSIPKVFPKLLLPSRFDDF